MRQNVCRVLSGLLCLLGMGCQISTQAPTPTPVPLAITERRTTYQVQRIDLVDMLQVTGHIVPSHQEALFFKASGRVSRVAVAVGDAVKAGDLLAELEMEDLLKQVQQATIDLETAEAKLAEDEKANEYAILRAKQQVASQELQLELARLTLADDKERLRIADINLTKARLALERAQAAYDKVAWQPGAEALPQAAALQAATLDYETAQANKAREENAQKAHQIQLKLAEQNLESAKLTVQQLSEGPGFYQKQAVERTRITLERLNAQVDERRIYAPFDGVILGGSLRPGETKQAFDVAFIIGDPRELIIGVSRSSNLRIDGVQPDMDITFTTANHPEPVKAELLTRFFPLERRHTAIEQPDNIYFAMTKIWPDLKLGDTANMRIVLDRREEVLAIPMDTIRRFLDRAFVVVQDGDLQKRVDVRIGLVANNWAEVEGDLREGDVIIAP